MGYLEDSIRMIQGIVFDLDGTLVDSLGVTFDAFNHGILQAGGKKHTPDEIMHYFGTGEDEIFKQILGQDSAPQAFSEFRDYMDAHLTQVPLHSGAGDLLEKLKSKAVPISIFTGRSWDTTEMILRYHGLLDRFITIVAHDHVDFPKPSPAGLHIALSKMKLQPTEVLFVGDSPVDMMASRAAGAPGVAALWDLLAKRELMAPHAPSHWATQPQQVWEIYEELSGL